MGFLGRFPAQWEKHARTLLAYPFGDELWLGALDRVRAEYDQLVMAIGKGEGLLIVLEESESAEVEKHVRGLATDVEILRLPLNDVWVRDSGPLFLLRPPEKASASTSLQAVQFHFNAWGKKFGWDKDDLISAAVVQHLGVSSFQSPLVFEGGSIDFNGHGCALTTRQCLLEPNRNPGLNEAELDAALRQLFGLKELVWLDRGLEGDHTDGHIDTIARFASHDTVVCHVAESEQHPSFVPLHKNLCQLQALAATGQSAVRHVVPLPVPQSTTLNWPGADAPTPFSYANFYFCNAGLLVPQFGDPHDQRALEVLQSLCPQIPVIGLPARYVMLGGGVFNCLTQQIPYIPNESASLVAP
jgi:agmatine deiminase